MASILLEIPQHKMPLVNDDFTGEKSPNADASRSYAKTYFNQSKTDARHYLPTSYITTSTGWEFFSNELEFE